jgi:hypothetical protein
MVEGRSTCGGPSTSTVRCWTSSYGLASYGAAKTPLPELATVEHLHVRAAARLNSRVEASHQPARRRERQMRRFASLHSAQRFLTAFSRFCNRFRPRRHLLTAAAYRATTRGRVASWREVASPRVAGYARHRLRDERTWLRSPTQSLT